MSRLKPIVCSDRGSHTARYAKSARMAVALCPILLFGSPDRASAADWLDDTGLRGSLAPVGYTRWDGWNAGVQAGLSNMNTDFGNSTGPLVAFILRNTTIENEFAPSNWTTLPANSTRGELFGGFIGYNMQWEQLVIGFDFAYKYMSGLESSAADSIARQVHTTADNFDNTVDIDARSTVKLLDYATLRARAGYAYGQFLPYALVGAVA